MRISVANSTLSGHFGDEEAIRILAQIGYEAIDFRITERESADIRSDYVSHCTGLKRIADDCGIAIGQFHAVAPSYVNDNPEKTKMMFGAVTHCIEAAGIMGAPYVVVHPPIPRDYRYHDHRLECKEISMEFFNKLIPYAKAAGVKIAIENMWNYDYVRGRICPTVCSEAAELADYIDTLGTDVFGACLDLGHSLLTYEHPHEAIRFLGDRLLTVHIQDVDGVNDLHTVPYLGICDWKECAKAFKDIGFKGDLNMEIGGFLGAFPDELTVEAHKFAFLVIKHFRDSLINQR